MMSLKKLAIIQARMSSSRLPGKVLINIAGRPLLQFMLERVKMAKYLDGVLLATTTDPSDDILEQFCQDQNIPCFRGSKTDVLDRFYHAASQYRADIIVRLTADCPLIDPGMIDLTMDVFLGNFLPQNPSISSTISDKNLTSTYPNDFAANRFPPPWKRSLPIGLDVEICSIDSLHRAFLEADQPYQREHVLPYLYEGISFQETSLLPGQEWYIESGCSPHGFRVSLLNHSPNIGSLRWTVDTPADLDFVRKVVAHFEGQPHFSWRDILDLLEREPDLASINADVKHKSAYDVDHRAFGE
jgi:spore coat polysaccharide biosynthesis protein SpsF